MTRTDLYETSFITSSHNPPDHGFFQGYCFIDNDLIFGSSGAHHYQALTGKPIPPAQDGCYVTVQQDNGAYIFDIDFSGYKILYYYHDGTTWVVSNSFAQTVDFLREHNIPVDPNYPHLAAIGGRGMASGQLFSLKTLVREIRVAPRTHSLIITPHEAILHRRPTLTAQQDDYPTALSDYLNTWVSRFETLMYSTETDFTVDLTGGVDSRANFALVQAANRRLGTAGTPPRLRSGSTPENTIDLEVAETVARHFGLEVNDDREISRLALQGDESFRMHRNLTMGTYYPLYRPDQGPTPTNISITGGGGGVHRKTYELHIKRNDVNYFIERYSQYFKRPEFEAEFIRDGHDFLNIALQDGEDPLRVLLRDGRVRYHAGRAPRTGVSFTPLHSVDADRTQLLAGYDRIEEGQFNYDIMHSLEPELVTMPYDSDRKAPTQAIIDRLTSTPIPSDANPGRVWAPTAHLIPLPEEGQPDPLDAYKQAFDKAMDNPFVTNFWDEEMLKNAQDLMDTLYAGESIGNAANGKPISAVLSADLVTPS
jgi:hypothetical protein